MSQMRVKLFSSQTTPVQTQKVEDDINDILSQEKATFIELKETTNKLILFYNLKESEK